MMCAYTHRRGHTEKRTHRHLQSRITRTLSKGLMVLWVWAGNCTGQRKWLYLCNNCRWVAAACAYTAYLFHQWHAPQIWFIQCVYLTGIIRSEKDLGTNIERLEIHICIHQFPHTNLNLFKRLLDVPTPTYASQHLNTALRVSWA